MSCAVCKRQTEDGALICTQPECKIKVETAATGTYVIDRIQAPWAKLLVSITYATLISDRRGLVFIPCPLFFQNVKTKQRDFKRLVEAITKLYTGWREISHSEAKSDAEFKKEIGDDAFCLLKFIFMSQIHKLEELEIPKKVANIKVFRVLSLKRREEEFQQLRPSGCLMFHGSQTVNWYSILRNGIRNCSRTPLMVCGDSKGSGVYLSDQLETSYGYSYVNLIAPTAESIPKILGVVEIAKPKAKYDRGTHEFVVQDDREVILRYILVFYEATAADLRSCLNDLKIYTG